MKFAVLYYDKRHYVLYAAKTLKKLQNGKAMATSDILLEHQCY